MIGTLTGNAMEFPVILPGVELHRTAQEGNLLVSTLPRRLDGSLTDGAGFDAHDTYKVEGYLIDYLALCDGVSSFAAIQARFAAEYGPLFGPMLAAKCETWIEQHPHFVRCQDARADASDPPRLTGTKDGFYPLHATFEIIETCNFACDHCYYQAAPWKTGRISLGDAKTIMDTLARNGVRCLELTGGECTVHPDFAEILQYAATTFDLVAVISNGYRIGTNSRTLAAITAHRNVVVQISIDAIGERHNEFRKHARAFDAAVEAIRKLRDAGVITRLASAISESNIDQVLPLYELGKELGVHRHSFAPVAPLGRGCNISDPHAGSRRITEAIETALAPYVADPVLNNYAEFSSAAEAYEPPRNCGAGWRTFAIDYDGNVRACNYSRDSKKFGNILRDDYGALFSQQANFMFNNAPSPGGKDCAGCMYYTHCKGCFVKAFMVSETVYPECPWRRRWFPGMSLGLDARASESKPASERFRELPMFEPADGAHICGSCAGTG